MTFTLPVRIDVRARETVDNPFLILEIARRRERWRVLARLRLRGGPAGSPRVTVEAVDVHPATD